MSSRPLLTPKDLENVQKLKFYEALDSDTQRNVMFLLKNSNNSKVFFLTDPQGVSGTLFGTLANIDTTRELLNNALNGMVNIKEQDSFFTKYPEYGKAFKELVDKLREVEQLGYTVAANHLPISNIRNRYIKNEIKRRQPKPPQEVKKATPKVEVKTADKPKEVATTATKTKVATTATKVKAEATTVKAEATEEKK